MLLNVSLAVFNWSMIIVIILLQGQFREDNFNTAMAVLQNAGEAAKGDLIGRRGGSASGQGTNAFKIVKMIMERNFAPVICFSFSKKDCESYALQMSKLDFNTGMGIVKGKISLINILVVYFFRY